MNVTKKDAPQPRRAARGRPSPAQAARSDRQLGGEPPVPSPVPDDYGAHGFPSNLVGGLVLMGAAVAALLVANSPLASQYFALLSAPVGPVFSAKLGVMTPLLWINDGLMAVFFLYVGLEVKREWLVGGLSDAESRRLPILAAAVGMVVPASLYLLVVSGEAGLVRGWAIPAATDIAFALGVLALLGRRVPPSLKLMLAAIAIVDDIGAILVIAIGYTVAISGPALLVAAAILGALYIANRMGVRVLWPYLLGFLLLWLAVLLSGVHATIAGVLAAMAVPLRSRKGSSRVPKTPLVRLEHRLHPWVALLIVPVFGFANAGVALGHVGFSALLSPLPLAIVFGLAVGKPLGIWTCVRIADAVGFARRPAGTGWWQILGVAQLCGIGFTMSLFIGGLAFTDPAMMDAVKLGVLSASLIAGVVGYAILRLAAGGEEPQA